MATQLHVAHSSSIGGIGMLAAGPYDCAQYSLPRALDTCLKGTNISADDSLDRARKRSLDGEIDSLTNLADDSVWLFHGTADDVVDTSVTKAAYDFYSAIVTSAPVTFVNDLPAAHGMPTLDTGASCGTRSAPYLNACSFDAAGELLNYLHKLPSGKATADLSQLQPFEQSCCATSQAQLAETGYVFKPAICESQQCDIHMVLHGCQQSEQFVQKQFIEQAGYLPWAQRNDLILIFPQAASSAVNPAGCWDWWGYTGADYATREAPQVKALIGMYRYFSTGEPSR